MLGVSPILGREELLAKARLGLPELASHARTSSLLLRFCLGTGTEVITQPLAATSLLTPVRHRITQQLRRSADSG